MKKNQLWTIAAALLLTISLVFVGCGDGAGDGGGSVSSGVEGTPVSWAELELAIAAYDNGDGDTSLAGPYAVVGPVAVVTSGLTIPPNFTVNAYVNVPLTGPLNIGGTLNITNGTTLSGNQNIFIGLGNGETGSTTAPGALNIKAGGKLTTALTNLKPAKTVADGVVTTGVIADADIPVSTNWSNGTWVKTGQSLPEAVLHFDDGAIYGGAVAYTATATATEAEWATILGLVASTQPVLGDLTVGTGAVFTETGNLVVPKNVGLTFSAVVTSFGTNTITVNKGGKLTFSGAATLTTTGNITVDGTLALGSSATGFAPGANVTVNSTGVITVANSATLSTTAGKTITVNGIIKDGSANGVLVVSGVTLGTTTAAGTTVTYKGSATPTIEVSAIAADTAAPIVLAAGGSITDVTATKGWSLEGNATGGSLKFKASADTKKLIIGNGIIATDDTIAAFTAGVVTLTGDATIEVTGDLALNRAIIDLSAAGTINIASGGFLVLAAGNSSNALGNGGAISTGTGSGKGAVGKSIGAGDLSDSGTNNAAGNIGSTVVDDSTAAAGAIITKDTVFVVNAASTGGSSYGSDIKVVVGTSKS
ncbi:hypothetical protein AGMMS49587_08720 [Spirochaetia bacterium]|nr:hypothetical protein AGMMS49587_08720 [Spirochaetia bacterium]